MKRHWLVIAVFAASLLAGCATADFKVVDALHPGMGEAEARATIASFGFDLNASLRRPESGWPERSSSPWQLDERAAFEEKNLSQRISVAEYYPVYHGMFGFGQLFLFYGEDGKLRSHYRRQIN
jgi:hypothetical protein